MPLATTETPSGTSTTSVTPFTFFASAASKETSLAPKPGGHAITAVSRPGSLTSMVYTAVPLHFDGESTRGVERSLPMKLNCAGFFSVGLAGGVCLLAAAAISPYVARLPDACVSVFFEVCISLAGTCQASAAAATSIALALAPAPRHCRNELAIADEPPVPCIGPKLRLL